MNRQQWRNLVQERLDWYNQTKQDIRERAARLTQEKTGMDAEIRKHCEWSRGIYELMVDDACVSLDAVIEELGYLLAMDAFDNEGQ